jgi:HEAT repeat protein
VRQAAFDALRKFQWQPEPTRAGITYWAMNGEWERCVEWLREGAPSLRATAADMLSIAGSYAVEPLAAALTDSESGVRQTAARGLGQVGDARAVDSLLAALADEQQAVREAAGTSLGALYRSGKLDEDSKLRIVGQRKRLDDLHVDTKSRHHEDDPQATRYFGTGKASDCTHLDEQVTKHTDTGPKVKL